MSEIVEAVPQTKSEILTEMRELQQSYARAAAKLKEFSFAEDKAIYEKRQLERLEQYKAKYKFYVEADGTAKEIDWVEVEKLITTSFGSYGDSKGQGYGLGSDSDGMEGLGHDNGNGGSFSAMVEEEADARKLTERLKRKEEFLARAKRSK